LAPREIFISAGEASGDRYAAQLAVELRKRAPDIPISGLGGPCMGRTAPLWFRDVAAHAAMGLRNVARNLPHYARIFRASVSRLAAARPAAFVPIDNPGFNLRLAAAARARGIPVIYYVSPQVWAWMPSRIHRIARLVDEMLVILPFEERLYRDLGVPCRFVGHPLVDYIQAAGVARRMVAQLAVRSSPLVGLLPGSRRQEVRRNLPIILQAAALVKRSVPEARFVVACADRDHVPLAREAMSRCGFDCAVLARYTFEIMNASRVCIVVSGTATLELAHFHTPMVVVYRVHRLAKWPTRRLIRTPYICLVNILAGREVVPELLLFRDDHEAVARHAIRFLADTSAWKNCRRELRRVSQMLGTGGASAGAAEEILKACGSGARYS